VKKKRFLGEEIKAALMLEQKGCRNKLNYFG
jgi:hypothetical protein